jgi:uncharacterized membrane protein YdjX (TVP38/TMEM64 family)
VALVVALVVLWHALPMPTVDDIRDDIDFFGWWGGVVFVVGYGILSLVPIPKSVVSIAAGLVWGFWLGTVLVTVASAIGAGLAFLIGRALGQDLVERIIGGRLRRIDDALSRKGLRAVIVLRLIPVLPFTVVNYGAGLTEVTTRDYALGTLIGMLPGTVVFVAIGAVGQSFT